jgi:hypothetical protein
MQEGESMTANAEPKYIAGVINQYYRNRRDEIENHPHKIEMMYASRNRLTGNYSLYKVESTGANSDRLLRAAHNFDVGDFNDADKNRKIKSGLSLRDAFNLVRKDESNPKEVFVHIPSKDILDGLVMMGRLLPDGKTLLQQKPPATPFYWRNIPDQRITPLTKDEKIALLEKSIEGLESEQEQDRQIQKAGYAGAALFAGAAGICSEFPSLCETFAGHVQPVQLLTYAGGSVVLSLAMMAILRGIEPEIGMRKELLEKIRTARPDAP